MNPKWFAHHTAYTTSKYAMSMIGLGLAEELREQGIACHSLWPRTVIATSALRIAAPEVAGQARVPKIMADAAWHILTRPSRDFTGRLLLDEQVLRDAGVTDFNQYLVAPGCGPLIHFFVEP
ncbi:hypothetical protein [Variovorax terrae]|uniref:Short chain dehydrogenase n=1 Tax=Variovorax terrae TaxID=2923278 RepID=A0A9X1VX76_9BURK|nr:hypothetical protein [Variovorax terrae]MCJ0764908.1 hypothetical protein [Variovorax terrae]